MVYDKIVLRQFWEGSPFPELYEDSPKTPLCERLAKGKHKSELILIHHLHEVSLPFILGLSEGYSIRKIIGIPYSSVDSIVDELSKNFDVIVPSSLEDITKSVKEEIISSTKDIIIEEVGGYTSSIAAFLDKQPNIRGIVEDTTAGHWRWQKKNLTRLPVMSIAYSQLKRVEDPYVSKSIIDGTARFLHENNLPPLLEDKTLILGYGNIGQQLANHIRPLCRELKIYDNNNLKLLMALSKDFQTTKLLSDNDIVFGVTGNPKHSIKIKDIPRIDNNTLLISGSSRKIEFDLNGFQKIADTLTKEESIWIYNFKGKRIRVANFGEPINLRYSVIPSKILDLVYGSLVWSINELDKNYVKAGIQNITDSCQELIAREYLKIYNLS